MSVEPLDGCLLTKKKYDYKSGFKDVYNNLRDYGEEVFHTPSEEVLEKLRNAKTGCKLKVPCDLAIDKKNNVVYTFKSRKKNHKKERQYYVMFKETYEDFRKRTEWDS